MCSTKGWSVKGTPALQETVAEGKNMTIMLGISSEGDYALMVKHGFFSIVLITFSSYFLKEFWVETQIGPGRTLLHLTTAESKRIISTVESCC